MDWIFLEALRIDAVIGILPHEQEAPQPLRLDLELGIDSRIAAASGALADSIDYAAVAACLTTHIGARRWDLVETLAESCAARLHAEFGARRLRLRVAKLRAVTAAAAVGVSIERGFDG